ncbi:MAG: hypothetical protein ACREA3_01215 [Nitrosotalea sp.]
MAWVVGAAILGAIAYILSKDDDQPRCPNCKSFVKKHAKRCPRCYAKLGWE